MCLICIKRLMITLYFECIDSCTNNSEFFYSVPLILIFVKEDGGRGGREGGGDGITKEIWKFPR